MESYLVAEEHDLTLVPSFDAFDPLLEETEHWEERMTLSLNIPANAILNAKKCQSWNNHNAIVLSLFTEISVIALHSDSIFKVHCARKK